MIERFLKYFLYNRRFDGLKFCTKELDWVDCNLFNWYHFRHSQSLLDWVSTTVRCMRMHVDWWPNKLWPSKYCLSTLQQDRRKQRNLWYVDFYSVLRDDIVRVLRVIE